MPAVLSDTDRARLIKLLGMLGSSHDGERANAGALADKLVRASGETWDDVVRPTGQQARQHAPPPRRTWRHVVQDCLAMPDRLTGWEQDFLANIRGWRGSLTRKQADRLVIIAERLGVEPATP